MVVYSPASKKTFTIATVKPSKLGDYYHLTCLCGEEAKAAPDCSASVVGFAK